MSLILNNTYSLNSRLTENFQTTKDKPKINNVKKLEELKQAAKNEEKNTTVNSFIKSVATNIVNEKLKDLYPNSKVSPEVIEKIKNNAGKLISDITNKKLSPLKIISLIYNSLSGDCNDLFSNMNLNNNLKGIVSGALLSAANDIFNCLPDNEEDLKNLAINTIEAKILNKGLLSKAKIDVNKLNNLTSNPIINETVKTAIDKTGIVNKINSKVSGEVKNATSLTVDTIFNTGEILANKTLTTIRKAKETKNFDDNIKNSDTVITDNTEEPATSITEEAMNNLNNASTKEEKMEILSTGNNSIAIANNLLTRSNINSYNVNTTDNPYEVTCLEQTPTNEKELINQIEGVE